MPDKDLQEFKADHSGGDAVEGSEVFDPVVGAGGAIKKRRGDVDKSADPKASRVNNVAPDNDYVSEDVDFDSLFDGMDVSEEFKSKIALVFESAVNESVRSIVEDLTEKLTEDLTTTFEEMKENLSESMEEEVQNNINESMEEIIENLDNYLDYVVKEWMSENEVAIESGIKVEMAESLMDSLKQVFYEHNIEIDDTSIDVVAGLEEELAEARSQINKLINEDIKSKENINLLQAAHIFTEMTQGLTDTQIERFKILSEKLNYDDLDSFESDLATIKESFFKTKKRSASVISESEEEEGELLSEQTSPVKYGDDSINAIAAAISSFRG